MIKFKNFLKLIRIKQWVKNFFVFPALLFSKAFLKKGNSFILDYSNITVVFLLFIVFCFLSSSVYILNDFVDIKEDRSHPKKRHRPLASGVIKIREAFVLFIILFTFTIILSFSFNYKTVIVLALYFLINIMYSFYLKHQPVLDIFTIAFGFLLRAIAGAFVINVNITKWFLITIFMLSLAIATIKRRGEYFIKEDERRKVLKYYNLEILDIFVCLASISALLTYCIFALTYEIKSFYITIPVAIYGVMRYLYISYIEKNNSDEPDEAIVKDIHLILTGILYLILTFLSMFVFH